MAFLRHLETNNKGKCYQPRPKGAKEGDMVSQEPVRAAIWKTGYQIRSVVVEG